ncbi:hypothetical protein EYC80_001664 [Monilinia laxa]|uniref:Uncharacterized protein n=1 Tax=Monilinia laxa TaxID=61186 RepID=A0A5N6K5L9_MONLA|nr:hypothetical protein EYC80_001664 [Monilinia laxa]
MNSPFPAIKKFFRSAKAAVKRRSIPDSAISIPTLLDKNFDDLITCEEGSSFDEPDSTGEVLDYVTSILENLPNALEKVVPGVEVFEERIVRWLHDVIETGYLVLEEDVWKDAPNETWEVFYEETFMERPEKGSDGDGNFLLEKFQYLLSNPDPKIAGVHPNFLDKEVFDTERYQTPLSYQYEPTKEEMDIFLWNVNMRLEQEILSAPQKVRRTVRRTWSEVSFSLRLKKQSKNLQMRDT